MKGKLFLITLITVVATGLIIRFGINSLKKMQDIPDRPVVNEHQNLMELIDSDMSDEETAKIISETEYTAAELNGFLGNVKSENPIHHSITMNKMQVLMTLLDKGADPNVTTSFSYTGLKYDANATVYFKDMSPAAYAVYCGNVSALGILIAHGADLNSRFSRQVYGTDGCLNYTAASYAESLGEKNMAGIIKEAGGIVPDCIYTRNKNHIFKN